MRRVMGLQPGRLIGRQRERGRVGLAESEGGESGQHLPGLRYHRLAVTALGRAGAEPRPHPGLAFSIAERAPGLIPLGQGAAGQDRDDLDDLFVKHHHPAGLGQHRLQIRMPVASATPPLPRFQEGRDHVALDRAGTKQGDVDDDVVELAGSELADQFPLARGFDLKASKGGRVTDQRVGLWIVEGRHRVDIDPLVFGSVDLGDGVRHRRLHANTQDIELE